MILSDEDLAIEKRGSELNSRLKNLSKEDELKLAGFFEWFIQESKKQFPEFYKTEKEKYDKISL